MIETVVFGVLLLLIMSAVSFYLYSRLVYSERKITLMENILLDIKMSMEMEREIHHGHTHETNEVNDVSSNLIEPTFEQLGSDETEFYKSVIENAPTVSADEAVLPEENTVSSQPSSTYENLSREELIAVAEKKGLRVPKRLNKQQILNLVRDADKNSSEFPETGSDGPLGASAGSVEGSSIISDKLEDTTLETSQ